MTALRRWLGRVRLILGMLGFTALTAWDLARVWNSPIRGSATWVEGTTAGLTLGVAATASWLAAAYPERSHVHVGWWHWATVIGWVVALATAHGHLGFAPMPTVTSGYIVGALWFDVSGVIGTAVVIASVFLRPPSRQSGVRPSDPGMP